MTVTLYGWGPMFGVPGPSPFVLKSELQLQLLRVDFARKLADLESVKKHKAPYVQDGGRLVQDSTFIRAHFEEKSGRDLDAGLSSAQRALAWSLERLLEDRLALINAHERWLEEDNFERGPMQFFRDVPEAMRGQVMKGAVEGIRAWHYGHGIGRHSRQERMWLAERDIAAVARALGDQPFMFGSQPTAVDGATFGVLVSCTSPIFSSRLPELVQKHDNLVNYLQRIEQRYFPADRW